MSYADEKAKARSKVSCNYYAEGLAESAQFRKEYKNDYKKVIKSHEMPMERSPRGVATLRLDSATTVRAETLGAGGFAVAERTLDPMAGTGFAVSDVLIVGGSGAGVVRGGMTLVPVVAEAYCGKRGNATTRSIPRARKLSRAAAIEGFP